VVLREAGVGNEVVGKDASATHRECRCAAFSAKIRRVSVSRQQQCVTAAAIHSKQGGEG
jgi:hypothetical protein